MTIYLIGYKCSGKTTTGKLLADKFDLRFVDLDEYIEKKFHSSIPELFTSVGEIQFRRIEREAFLEQAEKNDMLLSTGGGFPCWFNNMELLKKSGITIYLDTDIKILYQRMRKLSNTRPILNGLNGMSLKKHIKNLKKKNDLVYQGADIILKPEEIELDEMVNIIKEFSTTINER